MVVILLRRTFVSFELLKLLFLLVTAVSVQINGYNGGEALLVKMKIESRENATRYRLIERSMRDYLQNDPEADSSIIHVLIHPEANSRIAEAVLKACTETKSALLRSDEKNVSYDCNINDTCSKITRVIGIYNKVEDINPRDWKSIYGMAWNSRSKIAMWLDDSLNSDDSADKFKYENILETFWSLNAINVVLLTTPFCEIPKNCSDTWSPRVFSYDPFVSKSGHSDRRGKLYERSYNDILFPDKLSNLHGIPIRVSIYQQEPHSVLINNTQLGSGITVNNLRYIANWLNFTVELITGPTAFTSYTIQLPDGEVIGPIGDILKNRSAYLANSEYVQNTIGRRVEFIQPIARAKVMFLVPAAGKMPGIYRTFRSIDGSVALLTFVNLLFLMCYFVARKKRYPIFDSWRLLIYQQIEDISENTSERIFLIFWIIWAFVICTALQSQLIKDLTSPPFYKSIDTLKELAASSLKLMFEQVDIDSLKNSDFEVKNQLADRAIAEQNFARCTEILVTHRNVSCAIDSAYIMAAEKSLNRGKRKKSTASRSDSRRGREIVHIAKEILTEYWRTVVVQEGFPYLDKFNVAYLKIAEFGLLFKFKEDGRKYFEDNPPDTKHPKLSLDHFEGIFKILLFGHGVAFVAFLIEIIFHRVKKRLRINSCCPRRFKTLPVVRDRSHKSQSIRTIRIKLI